MAIVREDRPRWITSDGREHSTHEGARLHEVAWLLQERLLLPTHSAQETAKLLMAKAPNVINDIFVEIVAARFGVDPKNIAGVDKTLLNRAEIVEKTPAALKAPAPSFSSEYDKDPGF
jgi:hypothetical protein